MGLVALLIVALLGSVYSSIITSINKLELNQVTRTEMIALHNTVDDIRSIQIARGERMIILENNVKNVKEILTELKTDLKELKDFNMHPYSSIPKPVRQRYSK